MDVSIAATSRAVKVVLRGELDLATTPLFAREMDRAAALDRPLVVLDLFGVTFVDGAGLTALLEAARRGERDGWRLRVERPSAPIRRLFELTAIDQSLEVSAVPLH